MIPKMLRATHINMIGLHGVINLEKERVDERKKGCMFILDICRHRVVTTHVEIYMIE